MLFEDEDDYFTGSPKSKFFDIVFNANRSLVEEAVINIIERYSAMEILLEERIKNENELEYLLAEILSEKSDKVLQRKNNLFIAATGDVLTQQE